MTSKTLVPENYECARSVDPAFKLGLGPGVLGIKFILLTYIYVSTRDVYVTGSVFPQRHPAMTSEDLTGGVRLLNGAR